MQRPGKPQKKGGAFKRSHASINPDRRIKKKGPTGSRKSNGGGSSGGGNLRSKATIKRLNMYRGGTAKRNKKGEIVHGGEFADKFTTGGKAKANAARTAPNRKWFGNTRVVDATQLDRFREEMGAKVADPYTVVLRQKKLPMGLLAGAGDTSTRKERRMDFW